MKGNPRFVDFAPRRSWSTADLKQPLGTSCSFKHAMGKGGVDVLGGDLFALMGMKKFSVLDASEEQEAATDAAMGADDRVVSVLCTPVSGAAVTLSLCISPKLPATVMPPPPPPPPA